MTGQLLPEEGDRLLSGDFCQPSTQHAATETFRHGVPMWLSLAPTPPARAILLPSGDKSALDAQCAAEDFSPGLTETVSALVEWNPGGGEDRLGDPHRVIDLLERWLLLQHDVIEAKLQGLNLLETPGVVRPIEELPRVATVNRHAGDEGFGQLDNGLIWRHRVLRCGCPRLAGRGRNQVSQGSDSAERCRYKAITPLADS